MIIKTKHLAMKEEATLEKLRDLKMMLKQSQQPAVNYHASTDSPDQTFSSNNNTHTQNLTKTDFNAVTTNDTSIQSQINKKIKDKVSINSDTHSNQYHNNAFNETIDSIKETSKLQTMGYNQNKSSELNTIASFAHTGNSDNEVVPKNAILDPHPSHKFSAVDGEKCVPAAQHKKSVCDVDRNNNSWHKSLDSNNNNKHFTTNAPNHHIVQSNSADMVSLSYDEDLKVSDLVTDAKLTGTNGHHSSAKLSYQTDSNETRFTSFKLQSGSSSSKFESSSFITDAYTPLPVSSTILPSEYINSMSNKEQFDARKMGLSSRTFESALSHMLDSTVPSSRDYDKYARTSTSPSSPYRKQPERGRVSSHASRSSAKKVKSAKFTAESQSTIWGPDSKVR